MNTETEQFRVKLDIREQLKFNERLSVLLDDSDQVLVIGETEAEQILSCLDPNDCIKKSILELELPVKQAGLASPESHQHRKIKDLLTLLKLR